MGIPRSGCFQVQCASRTEKAFTVAGSTFMTFIYTSTPLYMQHGWADFIADFKLKLSARNIIFYIKKLKEYASRKSINSSNSILHIGKLCQNNFCLRTKPLNTQIQHQCIASLYIVLTLDNISNLASKLNIIEFQKHDHRTTWLRKQKMIHCQNHFYQKVSDFSDIHQKQALEKNAFIFRVSTGTNTSTVFSSLCRCCSSSMSTLKKNNGLPF